ncbi:MAG: hypothetical protein AB7H97_00705 [Pseudobdellovibrionaceae bacterium]
MDEIFGDLFKFLPSIVEFRYTADQKMLVHSALKTIFSLDHQVFSGGIYLYYETEKDAHGDFEQNEILYVGETDQYSKRFRNHNLDAPLNGNKRTFIDEYFKTHTHLGFYLFAFKRPVSYMNTEATGEDAIDHERDCALADESFKQHRHYFERILVQEFKNYRGRNPLWFNDRERKTFSRDEPKLQSAHFLRWFYGNGDYALDYHMDDGFELAAKMQAAAFNSMPSKLARMK